MTDHSDAFAVFAICFLRKTPFICATTRPDGKIGLPGGKVDNGESIFDAVIREAHEEGWNLTVTHEILHVAMVDGKKVVWIRCKTRSNPIVNNHKEKSRGIMPVAVLPESLSPGLGNEFLI